jgi:hypothetical protein
VTKTFAEIAARHAKFGESGMIMLSATAAGPFVWNFEFGSLGFVWNLVFGAWNFHDFW